MRPGANVDHHVIECLAAAQPGHGVAVGLEYLATAIAEGEPLVIRRNCSTQVGHTFYAVHRERGGIRPSDSIVHFKQDDAILQPSNDCSQLGVIRHLDSG